MRYLLLFLFSILLLGILILMLMGCETARVLYDDALNPPAETENGALIVFEEMPNTDRTYFCIFYQGKTTRLITIWDAETREHIAEATARLVVIGILSKPKEKQITFTLTQSDLETFLSYELTWETIIEKIIEVEVAMEEETETPVSYAELSGGTPVPFFGGGGGNTDENTEPTVSYVWHANGAHDEALESGGVRLSNCSRPDPNRGEGILCPEVDSNENQHAHEVE